MRPWNDSRSSSVRLSRKSSAMSARSSSDGCLIAIGRASFWVWGSDTRVRTTDDPPRRRWMTLRCVRERWRKEGKWSRWDLNPRPLECDSSALPTELRPHGGLADGKILTAAKLPAGPGLCKRKAAFRPVMAPRSPSRSPSSFACWRSMVESRASISRRSPSISLRGCTTSSRDPLIRKQFVHFLYIVQLGLSRYDQKT